MDTIIYIIPFFGILGLIYTYFKSSWIRKQDSGTDKMKKIAGHIAEGAMAWARCSRPRRRRQTAREMSGG